MNTVLVGFAVVLGVLRMAFFGIAVVAAVVCVLDWLVRTRRIQPFSPIARFMRSSVDPLMAPIERRVIRAGGTPASAPWWALIAVVIGGIVLLNLVGFLARQIMLVTMATSSGPGGLFQLLVTWTFSVLRIALWVVVISSWFRISPYSPWIRWAVALTDPLLRPLRRVVPPFGMMDMTPLAALFVLWLLERLLLGMTPR